MNLFLWNYLRKQISGVQVSQRTVEKWDNVTDV